MIPTGYNAINVLQQSSCASDVQLIPGYAWTTESYRQQSHGDYGLPTESSYTQAQTTAT